MTVSTKDRTHNFVFCVYGHALMSTLLVIGKDHGHMLMESALHSWHPFSIADADTKKSHDMPIFLLTHRIKEE